MSAAPVQPFGFAYCEKKGGIYVALYGGAGGMHASVILTDDEALAFAEKIRKAVAERPRAVSAADLGLEAA